MPAVSSWHLLRAVIIRCSHKVLHSPPESKPDIPDRFRALCGETTQPLPSRFDVGQTHEQSSPLSRLSQESLALAQVMGRIH